MSGTPIFTFQTVGNVATCAPLHLGWTFRGGDLPPSTGPIQLVISNIGVTQTAPGTHNLARASTPLIQVNQTISNTVDPLSGSFNWNQVNVASGWYHIIAYTTHSTLGDSNSFFVASSSDNGCLLTPNPSQTNTSPPSQTSTSTSSSPSNSPTGIPVSGSTSKSHNAGKIAGAVVGSVVAALILLLILLWTRRRYSSRRRSSNPWGRPPSAGHRPKSSLSKTHHPHADSTGTIISPITPSDQHGIPLKMPTTSSSSEEYVCDGIEKGYVFDEITPLPPSATTTMNGRPRSFSSNAIYENLEPPIALQERMDGGRRSMENGTLAVPSRATSNPPTPSISPLPVLDIRAPQEFERTSSGKRGSRKPVPSYDISEFPPSSFDNSFTNPMASQSTLVTLNGDRPVHYLIPDQPPPQRD